MSLVSFFYFCLAELAAELSRNQSGRPDPAVISVFLFRQLRGYGLALPGFVRFRSPGGWGGAAKLVLGMGAGHGLRRAMGLEAGGDGAWALSRGQESSLARVDFG